MFNLYTLCDHFVFDTIHIEIVYWRLLFSLTYSWDIHVGVHKLQLRVRYICNNLQSGDLCLSMVRAVFIWLLKAIAIALPHRLEQNIGGSTITSTHTTQFLVWINRIHCRFNILEHQITQLYLISLHQALWCSIHRIGSYQGSFDCSFFDPVKKAHAYPVISKMGLTSLSDRKR